MKTFTDVKKRLVVGAELTMRRHDWFPRGRLINRPRLIALRKPTYIKFSDNSRLDFPAACDITNITERLFSINLSPTECMTYEFTGERKC